MLIKKAEELRNKPFTYDHNGGIMIINPPRFEKLPNPSLSANF